MNAITWNGEKFEDSCCAAEAIVLAWSAGKSIRIEKESPSELVNQLMADLDVPMGVLVGDLEEAMEDYKSWQTEAMRFTSDDEDLTEENDHYRARAFR